MSVYVCALYVRVNGGAFLIDFVPILISDNAKLDAWCEQWSWNMYGAHFGVITTDTNVYGVVAMYTAKTYRIDENISKLMYSN